MKEFKYYSVWIEVDENDGCIKVMGCRLYMRFTAYGSDMREFGGKDSRGWAVNRIEIQTIINTEWDMNKDEKFVNNLCKKLDNIVTEYHKKGISLQY